MKLQRVLAARWPGGRIAAASWVRSSIKWHPGLVLAAVFAWFAATAGLRPLMVPDEGRYATAAWEMLRSGDWITPTFNGLPFFDKPPLYCWIAAAAMAVSGETEWAARLPAIVGATVLVFAPYRFAERWAGDLQARATLCVALTQPLVFSAAQYANLDMLVAGCIAGSILAFAHVVLVHDERHDGKQEQSGGAPSTLLLGYLFAALGVLAKGLIGVVLPALVIGCWLLAIRRARIALQLVSARGAALFAVLVVPWFALNQQRYGGFLDHFFVYQHFTRYTRGGFNNPQPFWFFAAVLPVLGLPWTAWLAGALRGGIRGDRSARPQMWLMTFWLVTVVVFFSLPRSKLVGYVLPAFAPLSYLVAAVGRRACAGSVRMRRLWWTSAALGVGCCGVALAATTLHPAKSTRPLARALVGAGHAAGQPVVFLDAYYYDLPFYARLREPVWVVERWNDPQIAVRDNWRKELVDSARFAPELGGTLLVARDRLAARLCRVDVAWLVGSPSNALRYAFVANAREVASTPEATLWRIEPKAGEASRSLACGDGLAASHRPSP